MDENIFNIVVYSHLPVKRVRLIGNKTPKLDDGGWRRLIFLQSF